MILIDEILEQLGGIGFLVKKERARLEKDGVSLFLEHLGFGPAGGYALRLVYSTDCEIEMHFEKHNLCWLPYYLRDSKTEIVLYEFLGARQPLRMDVEAGSYLIQRACFLELNLRAHGFDRLDHENLYHPLFAGGVS